MLRKNFLALSVTLLLNSVSFADHRDPDWVCVFQADGFKTEMVVKDKLRSQAYLEAEHQCFHQAGEAACNFYGCSVQLAQPVEWICVAYSQAVVAGVATDADQHHAQHDALTVCHARGFQNCVVRHCGQKQ